VNSGRFTFPARACWSEATVKVHVSRLLSKLDVTNRVQIAILVQDATLT
jgi:DNA-binding NarL/FixJ family response regulator